VLAASTTTAHVRAARLHTTLEAVLTKEWCWRGEMRDFVVSIKFWCLIVEPFFNSFSSHQSPIKTIRALPPRMKLKAASSPYFSENSWFENVHGHK